MKNETRRYLLIGGIVLPILLLFGMAQFRAGNPGLDRDPLYLLGVITGILVFCAASLAWYPVLLLTKCPHCEKRYFHFLFAIGFLFHNRCCQCNYRDA